MHILFSHMIWWNLWPTCQYYLELFSTSSFIIRKQRFYLCKNKEKKIPETSPVSGLKGLHCEIKLCIFIRQRSSRVWKFVFVVLSRHHEYEVQGCYSYPWPGDKTAKTSHDGWISGMLDLQYQSQQHGPNIGICELVYVIELSSVMQSYLERCSWCVLKEASVWRWVEFGQEWRIENPGTWLELNTIQLKNWIFIVRCC